MWGIVTVLGSSRERAREDEPTIENRLHFSSPCHLYISDLGCPYYYFQNSETVWAIADLLYGRPAGKNSSQCLWDGIYPQANRPGSQQSSLPNYQGM